MKKQPRQSPRYHGYHGSSPPLRRKSNAEWWTHDDEVVVQEQDDDDVNANNCSGILDDSFAIASELKYALCSKGQRSVRAMKDGVKKSIRRESLSSLQTSSREASLRVLNLSSELKTKSMRRLQNQQHLYETIRQLKERAIELLKEQQRNIRLNPSIVMAKTMRRSSISTSKLMPKLAKLSIGGNSSAEESFSTSSPSLDTSFESTISNESPTGVADETFAFQDGESSFDKLDASFVYEFNHKIDHSTLLTPRKKIVSSRVVNGTHHHTATDYSNVELELFMVQGDDTKHPTTGLTRAVNELDQVKVVGVNTKVTRAEQLLTKVEQIITESSRGQQNNSSLSLEEAIQLLDLLLEDKKEALPSTLSTDDLETNETVSLPLGKVQKPQQHQQRPTGIIKRGKIAKDCDSLSSDESTAPSSIATSKESTVPPSSSNVVGWGCNTITLDDIIDLLDGTINGGETTANYDMDDEFESESEDDEEDSAAEHHRRMRRRHHGEKSRGSRGRRSERQSHHEDRHRSSSANRRRRERRQRHRHHHSHQSRSLSPVEMNKERRYQVSFGPVSYSDE